MSENAQSDTQKPKHGKHAALLAIGFVATVVAQCFGIRNPNAYTAGALAVIMLSQPIVYFVVLGVIALIVAAIRRNVKRFWFPVLAWLFLAAGLFDIVVKGYNEFVLRPKIDRGIEELVRSGKLPSLNTPPSASLEPRLAKLTGKHGTYSIEFDAAKWEYDPETMADEEFSFTHIDGDVFAMIIPERLPMSKKLLREVVVDNMRSACTTFRILHEGSKTVRGVEVLCLTISGTVEGMPLIYHGYYYTGNAGTIQVVTYTGQSLFDDYRADMDAFLNGLVIFTGEQPASKPQDALRGHWVTSDHLAHYYFGPNKMTVVYPGQPSRELAYSVIGSSENSVKLDMIGGNAPHTREFIFFSDGRATQITRFGAAESKYELTFVDEKESP